MSSPFEHVNYWHHSPSAVQKPLAYNLFDKVLRARGEDMRFGCAVPRIAARMSPSCWMAPASIAIVIIRAWLLVPDQAVRKKMHP